MNSPCQAPAALGTVPTLQNTSLWLWGHHLCKIKYGLDDVFVFFFFIQRISVESNKDSAAAGTTRLRCPV